MLKRSTNLKNLLMLSIIWSSVSFAYYILAFYIRYLPGSIYSNTLASALSEILATFLSAVLFSKIGETRTFVFAFGSSFAFGLPLIYLKANAYPWVSASCILLTKFGVSCAFNLCYLITGDYFPRLYHSSIFGLCNLFARLVTIAAPLVAEAKEPTPMVLYCFVCLMSIGATL